MSYGAPFVLALAAVAAWLLGVDGDVCSGLLAAAVLALLIAPRP